MSNNHPVPEGKDPVLWQQAKKRAGFKTQAIIYVLVNGFLWALWYFNNSHKDSDGGIPWPLWPTLGWGIGLAFSFVGAYLSSGSTAVEREYEKLKNK